VPVKPSIRVCCGLQFFAVAVVECLSSLRLRLQSRVRSLSPGCKKSLGVLVALLNARDVLILGESDAAARCCTLHDLSQMADASPDCRCMAMGVDEPTAGVDLHARQVLWTMIKNASQRVAAVISTQVRLASLWSVGGQARGAIITHVLGA
jgi:ABC-type sugar transport system ATPase subunit